MNILLSERDIAKQKKFKSDVNYIRNEIITELYDGTYMKYSKILKSVVVLDLTKEKYINYWSNLYHNNKMYLPQIMKEVEDLFEYRLYDNTTFLKLVEIGKDNTKDKEKVINKLKKSVEKLESVEV